MKINLTDLGNLQNESTAVAAINTNNSVLEAAVENTISRDGTQPNQMNSLLDMNSNKIINLPDAYTDQEPVTYGQFIDGITSVNNGVVVDGAFIMAEHNDTTINDRVLVAGPNLEVTDGGPKSTFVVSVSDPELNAIASVNSSEDKLPYFTGVGTADVTDFTPFARTLVDDFDALTMRETLGSAIGTDVQAHSNTLDSLDASGTGMVSKTGIGTITPRTVTGTTNEVAVINGDGVSGDPTISLPNTLSLTGKTVSGGTFNTSAINSPSITTPTGIVKGDIGLGNVDNTSDVNKPISTATQTALNAKVAGPSSSVSGNLSTFNGTTGKVVQDSGYSLPNSALVGVSSAQTLTNKTISGSDNTITNVPNSSVVGLGSLALKNQASVPTDLGTTGTPDGTKFLRDDGQWTAIPGGGDMLSTNNLSDVSNITTARNNLDASQAKTPTYQTLTTSGTYIPTSSDIVWIEVHMVGGGGGGGAAGSVPGTPGTAGGTTTFNGVTAIGGGQGTNDNGSNNRRGGNGGQGGIGAAVYRAKGAAGSNGAGYFGGQGGSSYFGGGGNPGSNTSGDSGRDYSGGGGGAASNFAVPSGGGGGGSGEHVHLILPPGFYSYSIGAGGNGGTGVTNVGGAGGTGVIVVTEHY